MHLFSPLRGKSPNGLPTFLNCIEIVPHITVMQKAEGQVKLSAMLRNYDADSRSYSFHDKVLPIAELGHFFTLLQEDPEAAIATYFSWQPQEPRPERRAIAPSAEDLAASAEANDLMNDML